MRENGRLLSDIYSKVKQLAKPGVSTLQLAEYALEHMYANKCESAFLGYKDFPGAICISINEEVVHGIPSKHKILKQGDLVKLDMGLKKNGFYADMAKTFYLGDQTPPEIIRLLQTTQKALQAGINQIYAGNTLRNVSHAMQREIEGGNMSVIKRFVGHGIGKSLHEKPPVPNFVTSAKGPRLKEGMVLAIEPIASYGTGDVKITDDGWTAVTLNKELSAHFEHTVAITQQGPEILTINLPGGL